MRVLLQRRLQGFDMVSPFNTPLFLFVTFRLLGEVYYLLYDRNEMPSKAAIDPEQPSLGRIRADYIAPPHGLTSIILCISRVEETPALVYADLFPDISCDTPLEEGHISFLRTDAPGLSPKKPMAIVVPVDSESEPDSLAPDSPQSPDEPIAHWRAEVLFDCKFSYSLMIFLDLYFCCAELKFRSGFC